MIKLRTILTVCTTLLRQSLRLTQIAYSDLRKRLSGSFLTAMSRLGWGKKRQTVFDSRVPHCRLTRFHASTDAVLRIGKIYALLQSILLIAILPTSSIAIAQNAEPNIEPAMPVEGAATSTSGLNLDMKLDDLARQDVVIPGFSQVVNTVERQESTVGRSTAAVFVITPDMIKRSGARSIPEALRMAPGLDVARIDTDTWAISSRGFNNNFANKLLVQIDGRVVYNGTFGGVYWNQQSVVLPDVERIEVIRGPGTTMWGSNAMNGVINVITKKSSDTQGALIQSGGGDQERDFNTVRYGGKVGEDLTWRVFGQEFDRNRGWSDSGVHDNWVAHQGGFRLDYTPTEEDTFTLQGDLFDGTSGGRYNVAVPTPPFDADINALNQAPAGNLLLRYGRVLDEDTSWQIQTYYDHYQQLTPPILSETRDTWDIDLQYQFQLTPNHNFITGANYRRSQDGFTNSFAVGFEPTHFVTEWAGVFAQDTMTLVEDRWYFTLGTRLDNNTFGGFQVEPTARLLFLPSNRQTVWMAISRAIRNPTRSDADVLFNRHIAPPNVPLFFNLVGNPAIQPENMLAYEIGYRAAPTDDFSWDIAGYINDYHKLIGPGPIGAPVVQPPGVFLPSMQDNITRALSYGCETTATFQLTEDWRLFASYSLFEVQAQGIDAPGNALIEGSSPHNQIYLRSSWDLSQNLQFDLIGRYVDKLTALDVPKYIEMDARIGWQATKTLEFSFVGQNLLDSHHLEFIDTIGTASTQVRRGWYAMVSWEY